MRLGRRIRVLAAAFWLAGPAWLDGAWADGAASVASAPYATLLEGAASLDGTRVLFTGEAIGQVMERGGMAWVNVADAGGAIGVWMSAEAARSIATLGSYRFRGDELLVIGTFRRACGQHGGDMDIHAETVEIIRPGEPVARPVDATRLALAAASSLAAVVALLMLRKKDSRRRAAESSREAPRGAGRDEV